MVGARRGDSPKFNRNAGFLVAAAKIRCSKYVEFCLQPHDGSQWQASILATDVLKNTGKNDRISFIIDSKNMSDSLNPDRFRRPFKHPPTFQSDDVQNMVDGVVGDVNEEPEVRREKAPFMCLDS